MVNNYTQIEHNLIIGLNQIAEKPKVKIIDASDNFKGNVMVSIHVVNEHVDKVICIGKFDYTHTWENENAINHAKQWIENNKA